jgi:GNAT superfamily N-acetyltransferase
MNSERPSTSVSIYPAHFLPYLQNIRELFVEYEHSLGFPLCFQNFDKELENLPGEYSPPYGGLFIAVHERDVLGCIALRRIDDATCEMKRLYVRPAGRGKGIGTLLVKTLIETAKNHGYKQMKLDTVPSMKEAIRIYIRFGFKETDPYRNNPIPGALFMELDLQEFRNK